MKNPLMFKPMASPNRAQGLPAGARPYGAGVTNPLSAEGQGAQQMQGMEASGIPWMGGGFGPVPVPAGGMPMRSGGGGGGGGGGGFRMGPPRERKKIMRLGPRTADEWRAENGGGLPPIPGAGTPGSQTPATAGSNDLREAQGQVWDEEKGWTTPTMMAKGGKMPHGKPVLVGEEGPELILPRRDGSGFVLPADVTEQVLPMIPPKKTMKRAVGGPVPYSVLETPSGAFRGVQGQYGSGFASSRPGTAAVLEAQAPGPGRFMTDPTGRYQLDLNADGLPMLPDVVSGPWAEPGLPVTPAMVEGNREQIGGRIDRLRAAGATAPMGPMVFDAATGEQIPQSEMLQRVSMRGAELAGEIGAQREAADRARLATLPPIGTPQVPNMIPGPGGVMMRPPVARRLSREMERLAGTPAMAARAMESELSAGNAMEALNWQTLTDPTTGRPFAMVNGRGQQVRLPELQDDETIVQMEEEGTNEYGMTVIRKTPVIANRKTGVARRINLEDGTAVQAPPAVKPGTPAPGSKPPATSNVSPGFLKLRAQP